MDEINVRKSEPTDGRTDQQTEERTGEDEWMDGRTN